MTPRARWSCLFLGALLIAVRAPLLILRPRLVAEEASVYLAHALSHGWLQSLLLIPTSEGPAGYLHLPANLAATVPAHFLPLELAPAVATAIAFLLQLLPIALVLWGRSRFWTTPAQRLTCCALLVFAPAVRPVVWLSVINVQIFCGLGAFLILCEDLGSAGRRRLRLYRALLVFFGLSGGYAALLTLPFLWRARLDRGPEARIQALLVAGSAALQAALYLVVSRGVTMASDRFAASWSGGLAAILGESLIQPIAGSFLTRAWFGPQTVFWATVSGGIFSVSLLCAFGAWLVRRRTDRFFSLFPLSFASISIGTLILAFGVPTRRYAVLPGIILLLALLASTGGDPRGLRRPVSRVLVGISLVVGVTTYWLDAPPHYWQGKEVRYFGYLEGSPDWHHEIEDWRRNRRHLVRVWPYTSETTWTTLLSRRSDFLVARRSFETVEGVHLVGQKRKEARLRVPLDTVPPDFRVLIRGSCDRDPAVAKVTFGFEDAAGVSLFSRRVPRFRAGEPFLAHLTAEKLQERMIPGRNLAEIRSLTIRAESLDGEPVIVSIESVELVPRIEGLLDGTLPARTLPAGFYHGSAVRPLAQEATPLLALESLALDGDLAYRAEDQDRLERRWVGRRWRRGERGLALRPAAGGGRAYDEPLPFLLAALPSALGGPSGTVAFNLILVLVMAALWWRDFDRRPGGRLFALGSLCAAAGFGYVFLPQSQVFEMFCLFVPVRWWIRGELSAGEGEPWHGRRWRLPASGALLATAAVQEAAWGWIGAVILADLLVARRRRTALVLAAAAAAVLALWTLAPHVLAPTPDLADPIPAVHVEKGGAPARWTVGNVWRFYTARNGLIAGYPFVLLAVVAFFRGGDDRSRLLLLAALFALTAWIALRGTGVVPADPLGNPRFAVLYPLFAFLPRETVSWRWQVLPWAVVLLFSLGLMSAAWAPL